MKGRLCYEEIDQSIACHRSWSGMCGDRRLGCTRNRSGNRLDWHRSRTCGGRYCGCCTSGWRSSSGGKSQGIKEEMRWILKMGDVKKKKGLKTMLPVAAASVSPAAATAAASRRARPSRAAAAAHRPRGCSVAHSGSRRLCVTTSQHGYSRRSSPTRPAARSSPSPSD